MKKKAKHILFLSPGFAKDEADTQCLPYFLNYVLALKEKHPTLKLTVIATEYPTQKQQFYWKDIEIWALGHQKNTFLKKVNLITDTIKHIQKIHKKCPITAIHALWLHELSMIAFLIAKFLNINHICTAMGQDVLEKNPFLRWLPLKWMNIVAVSDFQQRKFNREVIAIIPWGISKSNISISSKTIDILNVGNINSIKNTHIFVEIINKIKSSYPKICCKIIGRDIKNGAIQQLINQYHLYENIIVTGELPNEKVLYEMKKAKILVHTADYESQGYVFLEALMCGMSLISKEVGIAKASHYWRIAKNEDEFVAILKETLEEDSLEISIIPYPISETVDKYHELYETRSLQSVNA